MDDHLNCFCFKYSEQDIITDYNKNGQSLILESIMNEKKCNGCLCSEKNPKGI